MDGCIFCQIVAGALPSAKRHECELVVAFDDIAPQAPLHVLLVSREQVALRGAPLNVLLALPVPGLGRHQDWVSAPAAPAPFSCQVLACAGGPLLKSP